jgi:hypothetical protein
MLLMQPCYGDAMSLGKMPHSEVATRPQNFNHRSIIKKHSQCGLGAITHGTQLRPKVMNWNSLTL